MWFFNFCIWNCRMQTMTHVAAGVKPRTYSWNRMHTHEVLTHAPQICSNYETVSCRGRRDSEHRVTPCLLWGFGHSICGTIYNKKTAWYCPSLAPCDFFIISHFICNIIQLSVLRLVLWIIISLFDFFSYNSKPIVGVIRTLNPDNKLWSYLPSIWSYSRLNSA